MNLDLHTFGKMPGAVYLAQLLNERGSSKQLRKVSQFLVTHAIIERDMKAAVMSPAIRLMAIAQWQRSILESELQGLDDLIMDVMKNVAMGKLKNVQDNG